MKIEEVRNIVKQLSNREVPEEEMMFTIMDLLIRQQKEPLIVDIPSPTIQYRVHYSYNIQGKDIEGFIDLFDAERIAAKVVRDLMDMEIPLIGRKIAYRIVAIDKSLNPLKDDYANQAVVDEAIGYHRRKTGK